jgi:hypothetical protein
MNWSSAESALQTLCPDPDKGHATDILGIERSLAFRTRPAAQYRIPQLRE